MEGWVWTIADSALWVLLGIPAFAVCRVAPLDGIRRPAGLPLHLLGAGMSSMAHETISALLYRDVDAAGRMIVQLDGLQRHILQPLVENAIRHGIAPRACAGHAGIVARRNGETLSIEIRDDGEGPRSSSGDRVGLSNIRRLEQIYGRDGQFHPRAGERGTVASLTLPLCAVKQ